VPDDIDRAQAINEELQADALASHFRRAAGRLRESAGECVECGDEIPEPRRRAVPGVKTCIDCQRQLERERGRK
jgi:phage/conjugal plasmid C-4 type zinc finger TraR family protein